MERAEELKLFLAGHSGSGAPGPGGGGGGSKAGGAPGRGPALARAEVRTTV